MIESLLLGAPGAVAGGLLAQAATAPVAARLGVRWLMRVNVTIAGAHRCWRWR